MGLATLQSRNPTSRNVQNNILTISKPQVVSWQLLHLHWYSTHKQQCWYAQGVHMCSTAYQCLASVCCSPVCSGNLVKRVVVWTHLEVSHLWQHRFRGCIAAEKQVKHRKIFLSSFSYISKGNLELCTALPLLSVSVYNVRLAFLFFLIPAMMTYSCSYIAMHFQLSCGTCELHSGG